MIEYAYIETTNHCNLQCSFCNRNQVIGALQHMSVAKFTELMERIKHHPIHTAKLMGMGEPFLHPEFDRICEIFKQYFPNAFLISATNCQYSLTTAVWFKRSLKYIDLLYLSIDGYKDSYERDRKPSTWSKLITFLEELKTVDRQGCKIVCNYVVNPDNVDDIQLVNDEIVIPYALEELRLNIAQDWNEDGIIPHGYMAKHLLYLQRNWQQHIQGKNEWNYSDCFWVKNGLYITVDGRVLACCMNTAAKSFGNIFTDTIENIHSGDAYQAIATGCANNTPTAHCANCSYRELAPLLNVLGVRRA